MLWWRPSWWKASAQPCSSLGTAAHGQSLCRSITAPCSEWVDHSRTALVWSCAKLTAPEGAGSEVRTGNGSGPQRLFKSCWRAALKRVHEGLWRDSHQWFWGDGFVGFWEWQFVGSVGGELKNLVNGSVCGSGRDGGFWSSQFFFRFLAAFCCQALIVCVLLDFFLSLPRDLLILLAFPNYQLLALLILSDVPLFSLSLIPTICAIFSFI